QRRVGNLAAHAALELGALAGVERREALLPVGVHRLAAGSRLAPGRKDVGRHLERSVGPAELLARALDLVAAERRAVRRRLAGLGRRAVADRRLARDHHRTV